MKLLKLLFYFFDKRTIFEKQEDEKIIKAITELSKTHHIIVGKYGSIRVVKKDTNND